MRVLLLFGLLLVVLAATAQKDSTAVQGEIVTSEVVIEKNKEIVLPVVEKLYQRAGLRSFETDPLKIPLTVFEPAMIWPAYKTDVPVKSFNQSYSSSMYPNYLKLGYGNFGSPMLDLGMFHTVREVDLKSNVFYERFNAGPVNGSNSGSAQGSVDFSASYQKNRIQLLPYLSFKNQQYRFYGNTNIDNVPFRMDANTRVSWNHLNTGLQFKATAGDLILEVSPMVSFAAQNIRNAGSLNQETMLGAKGSLLIIIDEVFSAGFDLGAQTASYTGGLDYTRSLLTINPSFKYSKDQLLIKAGFLLASSKTSGESTSGFYPDITAEWSFTDQWSVYGLVAGGVTWNGLNELLSQNEFLDDSLRIVNSELNSEFGAGITGSPVKNLTIDVGVRFGTLNDLPLFTPSSSDSSRFTVSYDDESIQRITFSTNLSYSPTNTSTYGASLQVNGYSTSVLDRAWHLPTFVFEAYTSHNISEKLLVSATVLTMGGIQAPANVDFGISDLDSFIVLGLGFNYLLSERGSAFIEVNNLLNKEYQRYIGYPVRGLTFKIGGQYRF